MTEPGDRLPRSRSLAPRIVLTVGLALVCLQIGVTAYEGIQDRRQVGIAAQARAEAVVDMVEAVHAQAMVNRRETADGDPAIATLNGTMDAYSRSLQGVRLWLVMAPKIVAYQIRNRQLELEDSKDDLDRAVIASGVSKTLESAGALRYSRPVILGYGPAADDRCGGCHTRLMGIQKGEVLGAYSVEVDTRPAVAAWKSGIADKAQHALVVAGLTLLVVLALLRSMILAPLARVDRSTRLLAKGNLDAEIDAPRRHDEIGRLALTLVDFRTALREREHLQDLADQSMRTQAAFLANMSHEIRTPLNGIIGITASLARTELAPDQQRMVQLISQSGETLERVVSDVLDISKIEAEGLMLEPLACDLQLELGGLCDEARLRAEDKGLTLRCVFDNCHGLFLVDPTRLKQVIGNLIGNALKFTEAGEVSILVRFNDETDTLTIEVADTGIGFDPTTMDDLFQRFSQADASITRRFGGTGLGLSIVRSLVDLMNGAIEVRSTPGSGSAFTIHIPIARTAPDPMQFDAPAPAAAPLSIQRVLLVEDHPVNQEVVRLILEAYGVEVEVAENGQIGLDLFAVGRFDLILMDMQMPVMDGLTATRAIREIERSEPTRIRTPIAVLSANAMEEHRDQALAAGADLHIAKPITPDRLMGVLAQLMTASVPIAQIA